MERLSHETLPSALFPQPPVIRFAPQRKTCLCGVPLVVQKTRRKSVLSLTGPFFAHETLLQCPACSRVFDSDTLSRIVPSRCNVAYDVMVFVGRALFLRHRSTEEVRTELVTRNVRLCASEVNYLGRKFISFLAMAHRQATPRIRWRMTRAGGYVLHLDATHEGDAPALMTGLDGLSKIVLANVKVPSESSAHISPFLRELQGAYGTPRACVHDMGTGLCKAVAEVFPNTPDFICHFHFAFSYSLALWALQGKHSGDGYGFPFDRPLLHFAERLLDIDKCLPEFLKQHLSDNRTEKKPLLKLERVVSEIAKDRVLHSAVKELRWRSEIFDRLRKAMRIAPHGGGSGLNDDGTHETISTIQQGVKLFRRQLDEDPKLSSDPLSRKMAEKIDKYGEKLFADPIEVDTPTGKVTIYPQRTNNILEQFFRKLKRGQRRKTGNNSMSRMLRTMLADTPLVKNLENSNYMEVLLDGKANLEELFSELGKTPFAADVNSQPDIDRILPRFRAIIKLPNLPDRVMRLFTKFQQMAKSN
ncbi:MAG: transposase [Desulfobacteraceae bacterium]|nr:transposase [Desulfobacteraceae bacterium]